MIDDAFRAVLPRYAGPLLALYRRLGLTPNQLSFIALGIALASAAAVASGRPLVGLVLWWSGRLLDGTDGIHARATRQATPFGAYLDILLDMTAYGAMVIALAIAHPDLYGRWLLILFLYVLCITSALALGVQEDARGIARRDDRGLRLGAGLAEGGETGIAYSVFLLWPGGLPITTVIWIGLLVVTVVARSVLAWRLLAPPNPGASARSEPGAPPERLETTAAPLATAGDRAESGPGEDGSTPTPRPESHGG